MPQGTCSVESCENDAKTRGWCRPHYKRWERLGDVQADRPFQQKRPAGAGGTCTIEGCGMPTRRRACAGHAARIRTHGDPQAHIPLLIRGALGPTPPCSIVGCDKPMKSRSMCIGHYSRLHRTGSPGAVELRARRHPIQPGDMCAVGGCDLPKKALDLCRAHHSRVKRGGGLRADLPVRPKGSPPRRCSIDSCERLHYGQGFCHAHYQRWRKTGDANAERDLNESGRVCKVEACGGPHHCLGFCIRHYFRFKKYGNAMVGHFAQSDLIRLTAKLPPVERFWARVDKGGPVPSWRPDLQPCWLWMGTMQKGGYGQIRMLVDGEIVKSAHRVSWALAGRKLIDGLHLDHLCRVRNCVNPDHLDQVTPQENNARGGSASARNARKTHCRRGHRFTPVNTYRMKNGARKCRACMSIADELRRSPTAEDAEITATYRALIANDPCFYCGKPGDHADHYYPISKGGPHLWWRLVSSCQTCNLKKFTRCGTAFKMMQGKRKRVATKPRRLEPAA